MTQAMGSAQAVARHVAVMLIIAQTFFALNGILVKVAVDGGVNPVVFAFWRDFCATPLLMLLANSQTFGPFRWPSGHYEMLMFLALGLTGPCSQMLTPMVLRYVEPTTFSLFQLLVPVVTPFLAMVSGLEGQQGRRYSDFGWYRALGLLLCIIGAGADILCKAGIRGRALGFVLLIFQVFLGSTYHLLVKKILADGAWPPTALTAWAYAIGTVQLGLAVAVERPPTMWLERDALIALVFAVLFTSVFGYTALSWANRQMGPTAVAAFAPLQIVMTTLIQPLAGLPHPSRMDWVSAMVVCIGLALFIEAEPSPEDAKQSKGESTPFKKDATPLGAATAAESVPSRWV